MNNYMSFSPLENAALALNYLTSMVDPKYDNLPFWLVLPHKKPAEAAHCRVDDAELVGSWYLGLDSVRKMLNTREGHDVQESFRRYLMKSYGEHGLRFHENFPWSCTMHSSFHEMGYILPALNKILENNPDDKEAEERASTLVKGMRSLVIERKVRTFWSGDYEETQPIYEFPNDVYLKNGGFDLTRHTGRGEQPIRNSIMLHSLVRRYELTGDETALDLALGIANHVLGVSRYFNYQMHFFGHVHSAAWFASGLVRLGRITKETNYVLKGKGIYDYIRSISSSFGWVPEYAQWHPPDEEHCESCCIKDMIECAYELVQCGYQEYWEDINSFARNQLVENQIRYSGYVVVDNSLPDQNGITWRDIDKRMLGGFTGGSLPNSISLSKFRSIAGCCAGMAPIALELVWNIAIQHNTNTVIVQIPLTRTCEDADIKCDYPNEGKISVTLKKPGNVAFRRYRFMGNDYVCSKNNSPAEYKVEDGLIVVRDVKPGETITLSCSMATQPKEEIVSGKKYTALWRGCDVVDILPRGEHLRLYQRDLTKERWDPTPDDVQYTGASNYGPTQQKQK